LIQYHPLVTQQVLEAVFEYVFHMCQCNNKKKKIRDHTKPIPKTKEKKRKKDRHIESATL